MNKKQQNGNNKCCLEGGQKINGQETHRNINTDRQTGGRERGGKERLKVTTRLSMNDKSKIFL